MPVKDPSITSARRYIDFLMARKNPAELPDIPYQCIINYLPDVSDAIKALHPCRSATLGITNPMHLDVFTPDNGRPFAMSHGLHGSPMAAVQLEELIALGCENFLVIGPAGHPSANTIPVLQLGELLLATSAWVFEGTTPHYSEHLQSFPATDAVRRLRTALQEMELHCREGAVATTDALYRETGPFLRKLLERQVLAVEMELSALFTVAKFHGKSLAGLLFISDIVSVEGCWDIALSPKVYRNVVRTLTDIVLAYRNQE
jgi:uridine phosphorylase